MKRKILIFLALPLLLADCQKKDTTGQTVPAIETETIVVKAQPATLMLKYPATLRGEQEIAILPQIEGKIVKVCVEEGQRVRRGQPLFVLDQAGYRASLATAQANVQAAQARVDNARLTLQSKQQLKEHFVHRSTGCHRLENSAGRTGAGTG